MNARIIAGCAVALFIPGGTVAVLSAGAPQVLAQAQAVPPPPSAGTQLPWSPARPPWVPEDRWIPINGALGIVIIPRQPPAALEPGGSNPPSLMGYFAVRRAGRWWRLHTMDGGFRLLAASAGEAASLEEDPRR